MFTGGFADSFDPNDWIIVCTTRTIDLSIRKLHSLTAKSPLWGALETNKTLKPCKYDYASCFKRVTPKHSLLARCKFATSSVYDKETSNGRLVAETRPMTPKRRILWNKLNTERTRVWVCPKHEGRSKQTKHWNHANRTMPRVTPKHSLLAGCKFATSSAYDKQTCT